MKTPSETVTPQSTNDKGKSPFGVHKAKRMPDLFVSTDVIRFSVEHNAMMLYSESDLNVSITVVDKGRERAMTPPPPPLPPAL